MKKFAILALAAALAGPAMALNAFDAASNYSAWANGSNGGFGFGAWSLNASPSSGHFIGSAVNNGSNPSGGAINTSGVSWGMWANNGAVSGAYRPFSSAMNVGDVLTVDFDNGWINSGNFVRVTLGNGSDQVDVRFTGGDSVYRINGLSTGIGFSDGGLTLRYQVVSATQALVKLGYKGSSPSYSNTFTVTNAKANYIYFANSSAGAGSNYDFFANSIRVVPEPSTILAAGVGVIGLALRRRKK